MFLFRSYGDVEVIHTKLDTGDYSIEGYEHLITIDRKATSGELYLNFGAGVGRFNDELARMALIPNSFFICSFPANDIITFPVNSGIPKSRWSKLRMRGPYLRKKIFEIEEKYPNIKFIFSSNWIEAEEKAYNILKEFYDQHK